jgi:hypothetical protein
MDFITDLPLSEGCDQLWGIIDRYPKIVHFIPVKKRTKRPKSLQQYSRKRTGDCPAYGLL